MNVKQVIAIIIAILGVVTASTAQLTDLFGPSTAKIVVTIAGLANSILAAVQLPFMTQSADVKSVLAMTGVEKIDVNAQANQTLAQIAVDPKVDKIAPTPAAVDTVTQTAKGA